MPKKTFQSIKQFELMQCILLVFLGLIFLVPLIQKEETAYVIISLYFFWVGLTSMIRGKKYQKDENIFQVTVTGGFIYIILALIIGVLTQIGPTLISIVLGLFIIIYAFTRGFFYQEIANMHGISLYNLVYAGLGLIVLFIPDERFELVKLLFGVIVILMGIMNYFVIVKQLTKNSREAI
ncbi:hypothetical protein [Vagococcus zengguangii]|uniref:Uncharacterized protein n=1 Tax=Vagococcus zengguangii TaxID=2571750 RepID=A0A4D7CTV5_9ENTE|nr:hypothetical protein [Vagococcus zengguangii]QCI85801.1 hypothetical protein FA707_01945 [Vagococcus zengguangii]TLG81742.1 hypothetical protein FE258_00925 [Vagococcus zengguangii]